MAVSQAATRLLLLLLYYISNDLHHLLLLLLHPDVAPPPSVHRATTQQRHRRAHRGVCLEMSLKQLVAGRHTPDKHVIESSIRRGEGGERHAAAAKG